MSVNKVITAVNALASDVTIPQSKRNEVICIDTINNRLGIKTSIPTTELDVRGTMKTNKLNITNGQNNDLYDITYDNQFLAFEKGISLQNNLDLCSNDIVDCSFLSVKEISGTNIILSNELSCNKVNTNVLTINTINSDVDMSSNDLSVNNLSIKSMINTDLSVNGDICCNIIRATNLEIKEITGDISFIGNFEFDGGNIVMDASLVIEGTTSINTLTVFSDDRLKHNEEIINNGLEVLRQLEPQKYQKTKTFKDLDFSGELLESYIVEAGLIAQDIEKIPEINFSVQSGTESVPYSLNYNNIFVYGLAAIKELDKKFTDNMNFKDNVNLGNIENFIKSQSMLIQTLNSKIIQLENRINVLENK